METLRRFWAWLLGYFWLPCPICGRMFGGYETASVGIIRTGKLVCKECEENAKEINKKDFKEGKICVYYEHSSL